MQEDWQDTWSIMGYHYAAVVRLAMYNSLLVTYESLDLAVLVTSLDGAQNKARDAFKLKHYYQF